MSLLIHGGTLVTSLDDPTVVAADVLIEDGRVRAMAPSLAGDWPLLDATGCLVVPGNVNAHTHTYSALARGMPYRLEPPRNFLEILQRVWWRLDRALDAPSIRASALVAAREALLSGTTTLIDHHASPNAIDGSLDILAAAFAQVGIRSILAYEISDRDGPERATAGLEENARFIGRSVTGETPLARAMLGAHASFTLSDETLAATADMARALRTGLHIHVAEDAIDEDDAWHRTGRRVVERLCDARALNRRALLAHAVHVDRFGVDLIRESGATVAHNPRSNMNNAVGRAPVGYLGDRVALGTDGIGSDMWAEAQTAFLRRREEAGSTEPAWAVGRLAVGARLVADVFAEPELGRIAIDAPADLVVLDYPPQTSVSGSNVAGHRIFGMSSAHVRDVLVQGEVVVRDRRLARVDESQIDALAAHQSRRLWRRMEDIEPHQFDPRAVSPVAGGAGGLRG